MHTPTPWKLCEIEIEDGEDRPYYLLIADENGDEVATIVHRPGPPVPDCKYDDGKYIVRAVNNHEALLEALERLTRWVGMGIADGAFDNCAAPNAAKSDLSQAEVTIAAAKEEA